MYKSALLFILIISFYQARPQCLVSSLTVNTAYNPLTGLSIAPGITGGTPVTDPHWILTAVSPGVATALPLTLPYLPLGSVLTEVIPGNSADVIEPAPGGWVSNPAGHPGNWISCVNSTWYYTDTITDYNMTLGRPFKMCTGDSIVLDLYIANDDWISSSNIDGIIPLSFSQPAGLTASHYTGYTHFTQTVYLTCGLHTVNFVVHNFNFNPVALGNATGLNVYGSFASSTGTPTIVSETDSECLTYSCPCSPPPCDSIAMPDTLYICNGGTITMPDSLYGPDSVLSITWSPAAGLSSTTIMNPTLTTTTSGWYDLSIQNIIPYNLVANGNFNDGNTGFTSAYTFTSGPGSLVPEGVYVVTTDPFLEHPGAVSFGDHTTGTGYMMAINGASTPISVWCETIPVTPNTNYDFSAWVANWSTADVGAACPILQFLINGVLIGTPYTITAAPATWVPFNATWNSGLSTTATICIYDECVAADGNDFALDDIGFQQICVSQDSTYVQITYPDTTRSNSDTTLCITAAPITLSAPPGYASYLWNTGATSASIPVSSTGNYWVQGTFGCTLFVDSFIVTYFPVPIVALGDDTEFCVGNTLVLSSPQPPGSIYLWNTGSVNDSILVSTSGAYWLQVNNHYCTAVDTIHVTISPHPMVDLGPDTANCQALPVTLQPSIIYPGATYLWSNGSTTVSIVDSLTGTFWLTETVAGCASSDTINVTIIYDTFALANADTSICRGNFVQAVLTANPAATFQWLPTAGIPFSTVPSPVITPDTSAMYYVHIYLTGCPQIVDSFFIDVQPVPRVYIGGDKQVCENDTLHIRSYINPGWYAHYSYVWSPGGYFDDSTASAVVFTPGINATITLKVTTPANCTGEDSAHITVYPIKFASLDTNYNLCPGDSVQLMPVGGAYYTWHPGKYLNDSASATPWVRAITTQDYSVIAVSQYGCLDTLNTSVIIRPNGVIYIGDDSVTLSPGQAYQITPQTNCVSFTWFPPAGLNESNISNPVATPGISTKYIVQGITEWGCIATDTLNIIIDPSNLLALPNAFTPGAGVDNILYILKKGQATLNYFRIYNRWGNLVYESSDINAGWDGNFHGQPQPFDVYVYEIEAVTNDGKIFHKHGNVTLIR